MNITKIVINEVLNQLYYLISGIYILIILLNTDNDYHYYILNNEFRFNILLVTFFAGIMHLLISFFYKNIKIKLIILIFILLFYILLIDGIPNVDTEVKIYYLLFYYIMFGFHGINIIYFLYKLKLGNDIK